MGSFFLLCYILHTAEILQNLHWPELALCNTRCNFFSSSALTFRLRARRIFSFLFRLCSIRCYSTSPFDTGPFFSPLSTLEGTTYSYPYKNTPILWFSQPQIQLQYTTDWAHLKITSGSEHNSLQALPAHLVYQIRHSWILMRVLKYSIEASLFENSSQ